MAEKYKLKNNNNKIPVLLSQKPCSNNYWKRLLFTFTFNMYKALKECIKVMPGVKSVLYMPGEK